MNKKNSQQNKSVSQSIWQKNGIPALEYCSLPRAAELLDCKMCDILHLSTVGAIQVGVLLNEFEAAVWMKDTIDITKNATSWYKDLRSAGRIDSLGWLASTDSPLSRVRFEIDYDEERSARRLFRDEKAEFRGNLLLARLSGLWGFQSHFEWESSMINFGVSSIATLGLVFYPADTPFSQASIKARLRGEKIPYEISYDALTEITTSDIYISRAQLEKIYYNVGKELPNYINHGVERPADDEQEKVGEVNNNKVGELLEMLIRCVPELGDGVMEASANKRHSILSAFLEEKQGEGRFTNMRMPSSPTLEKYFKI
ncbi:hypothetical protein EGG17_16220 [Salmonella enterica]|uniref:Uncharacterized protein n=3 Tax=Salmonella enterica TaxID=28901 RepID=A0A3Y7R0H8_SALDE|nr:hypothetical protein [Salmonella enterica]EAA8145682.1 hypothetical protein [Salmonella enterica subsp. enterica serovar Tennessee]EBL6658538.1 hypothetical protein [Salmonella enterica subsp. enterica serovar Putten]ECT3105655.1 hypothetical protein [Salmonella enterica subsp. enterica serovar Bareilly]EHH2654796.1 hypothetical protein [Salmonella enterica subsp. enterica serovar Worthington]EKQ7592750.1 hypothetical protein [Salmonella enterica subsp. enterica serovar Senftenberg]HCZ3834